eukprot:1150796-Pelagomonas_calceolata.AAC.16
MECRRPHNHSGRGASGAPHSQPSARAAAESYGGARMQCNSHELIILAQDAREGKITYEQEGVVFQKRVCMKECLARQNMPLGLS